MKTTQKNMKVFASDSPIEKKPREVIGWTVSDKLEEIQTKTKIKEGHFEWFAEKAKKAVEEKKKEIREKRRENKAWRLDAHSALNPHPKIIADAMRYDRTKQYAISNLKVPDALEWIDLESIDMEKACDELIYIRQKKEEKLEEAKQKLELLNSVVEEEKGKQLKQEQLKIQQLENEIQKKVTMEDTAYFVMKQYVAIAKILENDMIHFNNILKALEDDIEVQKEEIKNFEVIVQEENISKREAQKVYRQAEVEAAERAAEPERKMMWLRLEALNFMEYEMATMCSMPVFRESDSIEETEKSSLKTREMLTMYENSYKLLKDAMMATDIKQISMVLLSQEWAKEHLTQEINKHKTNIASQIRKQEIMEETYLEVVDALDEKRKKMKEEQQEILKCMEENDEEVRKAQQLMNSLGNLLAKLKSDLYCILSEFEDSVLVIREETKLMFGDAKELLTTCNRRIRNLMNDLKDLIGHLQETEENETFAEFTNSQEVANAANRRYINYAVVKVIQKPLPLHEPEEDEDNVVREMIKRAADKYSRKMKIKTRKQRHFFEE